MFRGKVLAEAAGEQRSAMSQSRERGPRRRRDRDRKTTAQPNGRTGSAKPGPQSDQDPPVDPDVTGDELDGDVLAELRGLHRAVATEVARHLVMAVRTLDEDPELAYQHTIAARRRAARIGVVREAVGIAAYATGRYREALAELRTVRRMTGAVDHLPLMADCERGLGRPRRALELAADPACTALDKAGRVEMMIVASGARRDLGDVESAVVSLQVPELRAPSREPWVARLRYAYADCLEAAGRRAEAARWFMAAAEADAEGETDATERLAALQVAEGSGAATSSGGR